MIISHRYRFIFLKTRKTGGTSVEIALSPFCSADDIITPIAPPDEALRASLGYPGPRNTEIAFRHYSRLDWLRLLEKRRRKRFFNHATAAYVRANIGSDIWNSYFKFCFERNPFDKAVSRYYWSTTDGQPTIESYLESAPVRLLSDWDTYTINDHIAVDFIGRYENLRQDLAHVASLLGLPAQPSLPRAKSEHRPKRTTYVELLTPRARGRIERVCAKELNAFDYRWDSKPALAARGPRPGPHPASKAGPSGTYSTKAQNTATVDLRRKQCSDGTP